MFPPDKTKETVVTATESFESLTHFCETGVVDPVLASYSPLPDACRREWQDTDDEDREAVIEFWAYILRQWAWCQDTRQVRILTDEFGNAGPDIVDGLPGLYRLVSTLAADNGGRWFSEDGLVEGRDYEFVED